MTPNPQIEARTAIEALRAGVPNRAAVRLMGTEQPAIEHAFDKALAAAWETQTPGLGIAGGFGAGKSHMLGYLAEVAANERFVVSRVVISKETPLSHPAHVFAAALQSAALPNSPDDPVAACVATLRDRPDAADSLEQAVSDPKAAFPPIFAACVYLLRRASTAPEMVHRIVRLWSGAKVSTPAIRQALTAAGVRGVFALKPVPAPAMTAHMTRFIPLLFRAAGHAGWCILLDEVELIGRYTPLQRAQAYVWLACWLGLDAADRTPGIVAAYAITDDFATAVINARLDDEKLPERLILKGRPIDAALASAGMAHIERTVAAHRLLAPNDHDLATCHDKVQLLYRDAYAWDPPALAPPTRTSSRTMRQYIKGWITQWDLDRLGGHHVSLVAEPIPTNYTEDDSLAAPPDLDTPDP